MRNAYQTAPESWAAEHILLRLLGERVRAARASRGMTRKRLARDSGVSERYLAQLEAGEGNPSVAVMREIAKALDLPIEKLVYNGPETPTELAHMSEYLRTLPPQDLKAALAKMRKVIAEHFGFGGSQAARHARVALIGLRGAGKSTLGARLGRELGAPFLELDRLIEIESGVSLSAIFDLYGQGGFRRLERRCLEDAIERYPRFVLATGGSLVSEPATFERLLTTCYTVWLRATPEDHMERVLAQGDMRPMADNREAMSDLRRILNVREPLYRKADLVVDTSEHSLAEAAEMIVRAVRSAEKQSPERPANDGHDQTGKESRNRTGG